MGRKLTLENSAFANPAYYSFIVKERLVSIKRWSPGHDDVALKGQLQQSIDSFLPSFV